MKTDIQLQKDILDELVWDPAINASRIGVAVKDGVVTLTGHIDTYAQKRAVEKAVQRVDGVQAIAVELDVALSPAHVRSDTEIAAAAEAAIRWQALAPLDRVRLRVEKGRITLTGEVDWEYQRRAADKAVHTLTGVVGVNNQIVVKPTSTAADIVERIQGAMTRQAQRESRRISVFLDGSTVTLRGNVHSWPERNAAQGAAWSAPGVTNVINELKVQA